VPKGEKRAGGRPKKVKNYSEKVKNNWLKAAAKIAKETGMSIEEHLLRMLISPDVQDTSKVGIGKLYNEALLVKETKSTVEEKKGPVVYLPEVKPKPKELEKVLAITGEKQS
jgi:hypothetical protein